jgi:hypothetical protein
MFLYVSSKITAIVETERLPRKISPATLALRLKIILAAFGLFARRRNGDGRPAAPSRRGLHQPGDKQTQAG